MAKKKKKGKRSSKPTGTQSTPAKIADQPSSRPGILTRIFGDFSRESVLEWVRSIAIAITLALLIRWPLIEPFKIPSGSMESTFYSGDRIFVDKLIYGVRFPLNGFRFPFTKQDLWYTDHRIWDGAKPERWDIVVFKSAEDRALHGTLVKRIVGLPGERVHISGGKIYINEEPQTLPDHMPDVYYTDNLREMRYGVRTEDEFSLIPEDHYFVLGDNSAHSQDARWFGWLPEHHLLGKVTSIWWPVARWRDFTGFTGKLWWNALLLSLLGLWGTRLLIGRSWRCDHDSLSGGISGGDHLFIRFALGLTVPFTRVRLSPGRALRRGETVLYRAPEKSTQQGALFIGTVAGLACEKVYLDQGRLTINGKPLDGESFLATTPFVSEDPDQRYGRSRGKDYSEVPQDHVFILADNKERDFDSRVLGWIPTRDIVGVANAVWWPLRRWRRLRSG